MPRSQQTFAIMQTTLKKMASNAAGLRRIEWPPHGYGKGEQ